MKRAILLAAAAALLLAGCGSSSDDTTTPTTAAGATTAQGTPAKATATAEKASNNTTATSLNVTMSVARGANATVRVGTAPNTKCTIAYTTPSGSPSDATGLEAKTADAKGELSWTWVVGPNTAPGKGSVKVTCDGQSASADITIT